MQYNNGEVKPWEQQKGEPEKSHECFKIYRDQGTTRTLIATCAEWKKRIEEERAKPVEDNAAPTAESDSKKTDDKYFDGKNLSSSRAYNRICKWAKEFKWVDRCRLFDIFQDRQQRSAKNQVIKEMNVRHANIAVVAQQKVIRRLSGITEAEMQMMDLKQVMEVAKLAIAIERTARGEAETITEENVNIKSEHTERQEIVLSVKQIMAKLPTEHVIALEKILREKHEAEAKEKPMIEVNAKPIPDGTPATG